ncbi:sensor histidine kinase [Allonocardiopsis opalescens]|uniref:histidine kinase n=1 Tax=Allonocardiopsis opalescens TaxID=1144618 RepID=A0A2T0Q4I6_9ACTN|nr:sensor histidine kinase [Allonocardiopsis opalescens]PRX98704.1 signal transduction histidine kinase [Allonocardiopsis opalescens]
MATVVPRPAAGVRAWLGSVAWTVPLTALAVLGLAVWVLSVATGVLVALWVGIPLVLLCVVMTRRLADLHRAWASEVLGRPIGRPYLPVPPRGSVSSLKAIAGDPATWRDFAWLLVNASAGIILHSLVLGLFAGGLWYLVLPALWWVVPEGALDLPLGLIESSRSSHPWVPLVLSAVSFALSWWLTPRLTWLNARMAASLLAPTRWSRLAGRVDQLAESRADTVDTHATELRRIERDLHDGAQARLVALGMSLGMAEEMLSRDPDAARELLAEARASSSQALAELRHLVRGIHPPVLADRGLEGAVRALAMTLPIPIDLDIELHGRPADPVESAVYFAVAESLANVTKHSGAHRVSLRVRHLDDRLSVLIRDDGRGGADPGRGSGLSGIRRRLAAFDGTLTVYSPAGGPTVVIMEVPCALSSQRTSSSSGTA